MNILHINSYYGKRLFYRELYERQKASGLAFRVYIPVPRSYDEQGKDFGDAALLSKNHGRFDRFVFSLKHRKILCDIEQKIDLANYSLMHAHSLFSNGWLAMKLSERYGLPYVVAVRSTDVDFFFRRMPHLHRLGRRVLEGASRVVFLSLSHRDKLFERYLSPTLARKIGEKSLIIPNGIDDFWFQHQAEAKTLIEGAPLRLLQVGDIRKRKNILTTLKVVDQLHASGVSVQLDVVGRIQDKKMGEAVKQHEHSRYLGFLPKEELLAIYRENDIFVLPSKQETFGLVYAEAMSQGLPLIYTKDQGFDGQFEEAQIGYHVDACDVLDIANKILKIRDDFSPMSSRALQLVDRFSWDAINKRLLALYEEMEQEQI